MNRPKVNLDKSLTNLNHWLRENWAEIENRQEHPVVKAFVYLAELKKYEELHKASQAFIKKARATAPEAQRLHRLSSDLRTLGLRCLHGNLPDRFVTLSPVILNENHIRLIECVAECTTAFTKALTSAIEGLETFQDKANRRHTIFFMDAWPMPISGGAHKSVLLKVITILRGGGLTFTEVGALIIDEYNDASPEVRGRRFRRLVGRSRRKPRATTRNGRKHQA